MEGQLTDETKGWQLPALIYIVLGKHPVIAPKSKTGCYIFEQCFVYLTRKRGKMDAVKELKDTNFLKKLRIDLVRKDEFTELMTLPKWSIGDVYVNAVQLLLPFIIQAALSEIGKLPANLFVVIFLLWVMRELLNKFPSLWKLFSLKREILQLRAGKSVASSIKSASPARSVDIFDRWISSVV